jgi:hypothetical protein
VSALQQKSKISGFTIYVMVHHAWHQGLNARIELLDARRQPARYWQTVDDVSAGTISTANEESETISVG